jgi:hypothetical protein
MTSTGIDHGAAFPAFALVAHVVVPHDAAANGTGVPVREHVLDYAELTDLVAEAIAESQRVHGAHGHTLWRDAEEAASLILQHVAAVCGVILDQSDSETDSANHGVSRDHA